MTSKLKLYCVTIASLGCLVGHVWGQQEQWLRYRTAEETYNFLGITYGQRAKPTTKAPDDLKLPKLKDDKPLFVKWNTPMVKKPVWLALIRSKKKGVYDRLYIDSNLDGSLADEKPIKAASTNVYSSGTYKRARFKFVKVKLPGDDGPVSYHLNIHYRLNSNQHHIFFHAGCWYEGPITVDGKKLWCTLIDNNANGRFCDASDKTAHIDRIRIAQKGDRSFRNRQKTDKTTFYVGRLIEVGGKYHSLTVSPDGAFVAFNPPGEVTTGKIQLGKTVNAFSAVGKEGCFFRDTVAGQAEVPTETYRIVTYEVNRKDKSGALWQMREHHASQEKTFTVEAGKTVTLKVGEPFVCVLRAYKSGPKRHGINVNIKTTNGDFLNFTRNGSRPSPPKIRITNADGTYDRTYSLEYG